MNDKKKNQTNYRKGISSNDNQSGTHKKEFRVKQKDGYIICKGTVLESYPNARFLVEIDNVGNKINATLAGRLRQNYVKILVGDRVLLELSIYDVSQGRISKRL